MEVKQSILIVQYYDRCLKRIVLYKMSIYSYESAINYYILHYILLLYIILYYFIDFREFINKQHKYLVADVLSGSTHNGGFQERNICYILYIR